MEISEVHTPAQALKAVESKHSVVLTREVGLEDEALIKAAALKRGVLALGPRCTFSLFEGKGLGIWNEFNPGPVSIVGTSASGLRALAVALNSLGISKVLHVGSRDLSQRVGALGTLSALKFLELDPTTELILIVGIAPPSSVERRLVSEVNQLKKPCVFCLPGSMMKDNCARTVKDAIRLASEELSKPVKFEPLSGWIVERESSEFAYGQRYIRGLYTGRFLCIESQIVLESQGKTPYSNVPLKPRQRLSDPHSSQGHSVVDISSPELAGSTNPVLKPDLIAERLLQESKDLGLAVVVLDIELGHGAHPNPGEVLGEAIVRAKERVEETGGYLSVVSTVLGTPGDPQSSERQSRLLEGAGAVVVPTTTHAVNLALEIVGVR